MFLFNKNKQKNTVLCNILQTQSRVVIGLFAGRNTLRHPHLMGLTNSPLCRRHGTEDETSAHTLCECEALASLRHVYLGSFFLDPEDFKSLSGGHLELKQRNRAPLNWYRIMAHKGPIN